ncbi:hypothetical protein ASG55_09935 [Pseudomonas sp. Leaf434]|nr:hypothetical protein ASG55_09935 [Pseudomonas sp. Leaf434]
MRSRQSFWMTRGGLPQSTGWTFQQLIISSAARHSLPWLRLFWISTRLSLWAQKRLSLELAMMER